ncbi:MAG: beta-propeller domain-containing protein [Polyangiaceae bacterium]|nr:beta-propeller domain-containing protein [Polyangiaceae bacterium]
MPKSVSWLRQALGALGLVGLSLGLVGAAGCRTSDALSVANKYPAHASLTPFASDSQLKSYLETLRGRPRPPHSAQPGGSADEGYSYGFESEPSAAPAPEASAAAPSKDGDESVTNVQHAGVDEGGIVKVHGDHLVVLRRGRLFTVRIGGGDLTPVSTVDAFGPGINPSGAWYDEMLLAKDTVVVIGYSYERGGTEVGLFDLGSSGKLAHRATYHLRSNDYYSSRNYASRLIGDKLIFYTPLYLELHSKDLFESFPAMRRFGSGMGRDGFQRIVSASDVFRPAVPLKPGSSAALHTVTVCDLGSRDMPCRATSVIGPAGRVFYVSPGSVYVWVSDHDERGRENSLVYRMPLDGGRPSALRVGGSPVDQFSFLESGDGHLNVLVRSEAHGEGMWGAEVAEGDVALMRVLLRSFGTGADRAPASAYRRLPRPLGHTFQNRFVASHLLYGTGSGWGDPEQHKSGTLFAVPYAGGALSQLRLAHGVDRIEALGSDAVAVGTDGKDLHFTPVRLGSRPAPLPAYTRREASQGELRSHGFFYKALAPDEGLLGLPIRESGRPGHDHLQFDSASVLYLQNKSLRFSELGTLGARPEAGQDDDCKASCVDWYGNARPLFLKNRVFALLGYELVEGRLDGGRISEVRRSSFAPRRPTIAR